MVRSLEMMCRVPMFRRIATRDVTASETDAEMHPLAANFDAVLADAFMRRLQILCLVNVFANSHVYSVRCS